ncbi:succinylglutamate desuccinylase [Paraburkholderia humisilvae]|uniref:Succinylglutamate desuccinylase n=1 Tax=Paraburkholderia humisilvae TaxID=627669 RepID=A0A6J5EQD2_9BURK|nr:succinylglutamate desuccinylase [Paraburkholderia humisilvae]CAB3767641.1 Succinylglutamate desuccinylase [Paraburkholderia humisilvae]
MLDDFLAYTLAGNRPDSAQQQGVCANGVGWRWLDDGVLQFEPPAGAGMSVGVTAHAGAAADPDAPVHSVLASAGVHGDETAPIELLSLLVRDIGAGRAPLACRLLVVLGNVAAMRAASRYIDDDLNRLFSGRHAQLPRSAEAPRAAALERAAAQFFANAPQRRSARWHIDMHTAIRASVFERFALLPHTGEPMSRAMFEWLRDAQIAAVLVHTTKGTTWSHFTAEACGADACTLELGKVRPFGQNDLTRFTGADAALRRLLAGETRRVSMPATDASVPRVFTVIDQITKHSDAFELLVDANVPNFTAYAQNTVLARDGGYRYTVSHAEERIVFPNPSVKPGLRAGLMVIETTQDVLASLH